MAYSAGVFYIDLEAGSDAIRTALTGCTAANPSGSITRLTKTAHGLATGMIVDASLFTAWLNAAWRITVVDANNFDLDGAVWQATADASGTIAPRGGGSKADAWLTGSSGATAARIQPGDTIRVIASPDETLVGDCGWTQYSKTITLPGAVTANITDCETVWTGSANVTQTADTVQYKEGTKSAKSVIAAGFTTGKVAYIATGTLDLSGYQQVSFWLYSTQAITTGMLSLRLCSDTVGDVTVHTLAVPAQPNTSDNWCSVTVNVGSNLNAAIASVALYADTDPGAQTIQLDNILACKAAASADSLTLNSLIGRVHNRVWEASTTYAVGNIRKPTQPNRNGFRYIVTAQTSASGSSEPSWPLEVGATVTDGGVTWSCEGLEDTWYPIQSINGTTVKIDNSVIYNAAQGSGQSGTTETVATYKREPIKLAMSSGATSTFQCLDSGTVLAPILYSGGWDRTSMATQTGETWISGQNGGGYGIRTDNRAHVHIENISGCRFGFGFYVDGGSWFQLRNTHFVGCSAGYYDGSGSAFNFSVAGAVFNNHSSSSGVDLSGSIGYVSMTRVAANNNGGSGFQQVSPQFYNVGAFKGQNLDALNNFVYGVTVEGGLSAALTRLRTANNTTAGIRTLYQSATLRDALLSDTTPMVAPTSGTDAYLWSQQHQQTANSHLGTTDGGTITSATDQRHTASGISWKFRPTNTSRGEAYPLRLSVAKIACAADVEVSLTIWTRRDSTDIAGCLKVKGGSVAGVPVDVSVSCAPAINTWEQSSALTFTPTEAGVVEVVFECWDGVGTTNNLWIDDFEVA